ncbi:MAG TPA: metal-dependent hydrolase [Kineosporiaceae bacterium]
MKGTTHRLLGACGGAALGMAMGWGWPQIVASGWLATLTAGGPTSPDVDQRLLWTLADRLLPDEWLGNHGPLQHRGIAHWWGVPATVAVVSWSTVPPRFVWIAYALIAGWTSHLVGDWFFGRSGQGRGPGIPFAPWWNHRGLGLAVGGLLERVVAALLPFVMLVQGFVVLRSLHP